MKILPSKLLIATKNKGKVEEILNLLLNEGFSFNVSSLDDLGINDEHIEDGKTFAENAIGKSLFYSKYAPDRLTIADDSGLSVDALDGAPGVRSARYSGENATDEENIIKLLRDLKDVRNRRAKFQTIVSISFNGDLIETFSGEVDGEILDEPRGNDGFGYDPIFYYPPMKKTFAELSIETKNEISHRAKAIKKAILFLKKI